VLLPGPSLHPLVPRILNRFRLFPVTLAGDVSKMFREVGLREEDMFLHRGPTGQIEDCRMTRVTFGIATSPYLTSNVLHKIAEDHQAHHPTASHLIKMSFYADDVLTGAKDAAILRSELNLLLARGQVTLCK